MLRRTLPPIRHCPLRLTLSNTLYQLADAAPSVGHCPLSWTLSTLSPLSNTVPMLDTVPYIGHCPLCQTLLDTIIIVDSDPSVDTVHFIDHCRVRPLSPLLEPVTLQLLIDDIRFV